MLSAFCFIFIKYNLNNYYAYNVITDIRSIAANDSLKFPAVTICMFNFTPSLEFLTFHLIDVFEKCSFDNLNDSCDLSDFEVQTIWFDIYQMKLNCYKF